MKQLKIGNSRKRLANQKPKKITFEQLSVEARERLIPEEVFNIIKIKYPIEIVDAHKDSDINMDKTAKLFKNNNNDYCHIENDYTPGVYTVHKFNTKNDISDIEIDFLHNSKMENLKKEDIERFINKK